MRKILFAFTIVITLAIVAFGQDKAPDKVKLSVGFTNTEFGNLLGTEYNQGLTAELDARIVGSKGFRLGGVFQFNRAALATNGADPLDTYSFGPRLSYKIGFVEPFGHALFGFQTNYNGNDRVFTRAYGAGVDLNFGHVFVRPAVIDFVRTEGFGSPSTQRFGAGVGVRF